MKQIDKLILCSPYTEPDQHWTYDLETQDYQIKSGRRPAGYSVAGRNQGDAGLFIELEVVNKIRDHFNRWKDDGCKGVTGVTKQLLEHWYRDEERTYPFFYCQLEAMETIIFFNEAPDSYKTGLDIEGDGGDFTRWCSKMATGSGKTTVMAMLIAYNILNKVAYRQDTRFTKDILIVAPGLTVKSRLAVLKPEAEDNYYDSFGVVPQELSDDLYQGRVKIINWHMLAWDDQEKIEKRKDRKFIRSVDKRKYIEISDRAYTKNVLGDMSNARSLLVINDEAHHAWRVAAESKVKGKRKDEIDNTIWVGGLDKLSSKVRILRCHDFTATPFAPTGGKSTESGLYSWIISDFSLNDAIESGLVKTPRVVVRDDGRLNAEYKSRLYHIYEDPEVKPDLQQKRIPKETPLPDLVSNAYDLLATDWKKTYQEWSKQGIEIPPVMMSIANTTYTADRIRHYFDSNRCNVSEICNSETTLQIDSKILGKIENEVDSLAGSKEELAEKLRLKVDTVGKKGQPGEQIRNVISVAMLSEGWDANNVSHIMGLRAFSSQLLCEQVIGRGLRRMSYEFDENKMLQPEYVNIFGVPFSFIPHEGGEGIPKASKAKFKIEPVEEKKDHEVSFPNILRVDTVYQSQLKLDLRHVEPIEIDPNDVITEANLGSTLQGEVIPAALTDVDLKKAASEYRIQTVIFKVATTIFATEKPSWKGDQYDFLRQLIKITENFIQSDKIRITSDLFATDPIRRNILLSLNMSKIVQHFFTALKDQNSERYAPVFDVDKPIRSSRDMPTWYTSKPREWHEKSHVNFTVYDSTWEANVGHILDKSEEVKSFVKNDHLKFIIKYNYRGVVKNYLPDYLIELSNGDKLILEVKGQDSDEVRAKREFLNIWVNAVNQIGGYGTWHWATAFNSSDVHDLLEKYKAFPTEVFLPEKEEKTEPEIEENKQDVSAYFDIPLSDLENAKDYKDIVKVAFKAMLNKNIDQIYGSIKHALADANEEFIDEEAFQDILYEQLDGLTPSEPRRFENQVRAQYPEAKYLHKKSLSYLTSSKYFWETLMYQQAEDYSPYVLQISRSVESELLHKVFLRFQNITRQNFSRPEEEYEHDVRNKDTKLFIRYIEQNRRSYTMGNMYTYLSHCQNTKVYENSPLIQDFRDFLDDEQASGLYSEDFLKELRKLLKKYRNKSAHISKLTRDDASDCDFLVRKIIKRMVSYLEG